MEWAIPSLDPVARVCRTSARAAFLLLLCAPNRRAFRSKLAGLLWPETREEHALDSLRSAFKVLRRVLTTTEGQTLLEPCGVGEVRLAGQEQLWVDADALEGLIQQASAAPTPQEALPLWQEADALHRGGFLQGDVDQEWANCLWVQERRQALGVARQQVVRYLSQSYLRLGQRARAEVLLTAHLMQFPADQDTLYRLMKLLIQAEYFREALSAYNYCRKELEALGKVPAPALQKLAQYLRTLDLTRTIHQPAQLDDPAPIVPQAAVDLIVIPSSLAPTLPQEALLPFSNAIKQGILDAARELEGADSLDKARRILLQQILSVAGVASMPPTALADQGALKQFLSTLPQSSASNKVASETLQSFADLTETCRHLSEGNELKLAEQILWAYLPHIESVAKMPCEQQHQAAHLTSQGYLLAASLVGHHNNLVARQHFSEQAFFYAELAGDPNLLVAALRQLAVTFDYGGYPHQVLQTYQQALPYLGAVSPLLRSCVYAALSGVHAQLHQKQEAHRFMGMAYECFPEHQEDEPHFLRTINASYHTLILWDGLNHLELGQPDKAEDILSRLDVFTPKVPIPKRIRIEFLNYQAKVFIAVDSLEPACTYLEEAVQAAVAIGSRRRLQESFTVYQELRKARPQERSVRELGDVFLQHLINQG